MPFPQPRRIALPNLPAPLAGITNIEQIRAFYVQFNLGRGVYHIAGAPQAHVHALLDGDPLNIIEITTTALKAALADDGMLPVYESGEPIEFIRYIAILTSGVVLFFEQDLAKTGDHCPSQTSKFRPRPKEEHEAIFFGPSEYADALRAGPPPAVTTPKSVKDARKFFLQLDLRTHPAVATEPFIRRAAARSVNTLAFRVEKRAREGLADPPQPIPQQHIEPIARLLEEIANACSLTDPAQLNLAFEMFATGVLRWQLSHGEWVTQPSSGWLFLFGEFALAAYELHRRPEWLEIARGMIGSQELFMLAYIRNPARRGFSAYCGCDYRGPVDDALRVKIRKQYENSSYQDLLSQAMNNAHTAFPDFGPPPPPIHPFQR